jgi:murein DD-endopeptidase MepM/ murein hydrolase activator NlpD
VRAVTWRSLVGAVIIVFAATVIAPAPSAVAATSVSYPSWSQVQAARKSEAATLTQIAAIKALLAKLQSDLTAAQADEDAKGDAYATAQDAYDEQVLATQDLQAQADAAQAKADAAKKAASRLIASLARAGSDDISLQLLAAGKDADSYLYRLGTMDRLSHQSSDVYTKAVQLQNSAQSLGDQAAVAQRELDKLKAAAEAALSAAQAATEKAEAAIAAQQDHQVELQAQLTVLTERRQATEADYQKGAIAREKARQAALAAAAAAARNAGVVNAYGWARPVAGHISSGFGLRFHPIYHRWILHTGTDIAGAGCGAPIHAAHSGTVTYAGRNGTLGNYIQIDHGDGTSSGYGHIVNGGILVRRGQQVSAGQQIARVGSTGASTGCHLHFIIRVHGNLTDPVPFMRGKGISLG